MHQLGDQAERLLTGENLGALKVNFNAIMLLRKLNSSMDEVDSSNLCNCRKAILKTFFKEIRSFVHDMLVEYEDHNKNMTMSTRRFAKAFVRIKQNIVCDTSLSTDLIEKFLLFKRTSAQHMIEQIRAFCKTHRFNRSDFVEYVLKLTTELVTTTINDVSHVIFVPKCLTCEFSIARLKAKTQIFKLVGNDFFRNQAWVENRIREIEATALRHGFKKIFLDVTINDSFADERVNATIETLKMNPMFNVLVRST